MVTELQLKEWLLTFEKNITPEPMSGCWLWTGEIINGRYGRFVKTVKGKKVRILAHRFSWEYHKGPIPEGMLVCHKCDVPSCVNPDHLFIGTSADNSRDMVEKGRSLKGEKNPRSKVTNAIAREIKKFKGPYSELMDRFALSQSTITHIKCGRTWSHVE